MIPGNFGSPDFKGSELNDHIVLRQDVLYSLVVRIQNENGSFAIAQTFHMADAKLIERIVGPINSRHSGQSDGCHLSVSLCKIEFNEAA